MNREDVIRMAREVGIVFANHTAVGSEENLLQNFANLVAAAEREACAKVADEVGDDDEDCHAWTAADAIRARGEKSERS